MPRPPESRFRRFMMQGVMWIILGGTVALAAMVSSQRQGKRQAQLGELTEIGSGISVKLPAGWEIEEETEPGTLVAARDRLFGRYISIDLEYLSVGELLGLSSAPQRPGAKSLGEVQLGAGKAVLELLHVKRGRSEFNEFRARRVLPPARRITVSLATLTTSKPQLAIEEALLRQVIASIQIDGDTGAPVGPATAPATQPE